ncbi:MAG TPA: hypothetical protein VE175_13320 [Woeseiaceae bacterium]|nr:hypothetical protein [Woeseiaceae bacterium]
MNSRRRALSRLAVRWHTLAVLYDEFLPVYDVSDSVASVVEADVPATWKALMEVDLIEVARQRPLVAILGALRTLPDAVAHLLHGERPHAPEHLRLRDASDIPSEQGGWVLLGERPQDEIALGLVGKFWRPVITFAKVAAEEFRDFTEPGYAKTVYSLSVRRLDDRRTLLSGVMRTATTDQQARRWFRRYWTLGVGSGAHVLVNGLLDLTREMAEQRNAAQNPDPDHE